MAKSSKSSASTWRRLDAAHRKEEKARRDANKARRQVWKDVATLVEAGFTPADFEESQ